VKGIIIGAGRGRRLMPLTEEVPKCYAEIGGRRILDWCLAALRHAGLRDIVFIDEAYTKLKHEALAASILRDRHP